MNVNMVASLNKYPNIPLAVEPPPLMAPTPVVAPVAAPVAAPAPVKPRAFYQQYQWHILPGKTDGTCTATNSTTGDTFEGTIADFNALMRG
jgi:hypothetical protein